MSNQSKVQESTKKTLVDIKTAFKSSDKPDLSPQQINDFQKELDELRYSIESKLGKEDIDYFQQIVDIQRYLEISGRLLIHFSIEPVSWALGVASLSAAHILENMEIGHNVIHGQYDFMGDETYNSDYEWTMTGTAKNWKRAHNHHHHAYTNVIGKDTDYGFGLYRFSEDIEWKPIHLLQVPFNVANALAFEFSVSLYDLQLTQYLLPKWLRQAEHDDLLPLPEVFQELKEFVAKASKKGLKEYVFYPALAGPLAPKVLAGNVSAQVIRNVWAFAVIYCGHLPDGNFTFTEKEMEAETKGQWYLRQILGSSNFEGGLLTHIMSGHLSHQIEHHLYPDLPAWRYRELGPKVQNICERYGVPYAKGKMVPMLGTVARRLVEHSLPEKVSEKITEKVPGLASIKNKFASLLNTAKPGTAEIQVISPKTKSSKSKLSAA
ncbi:MULTISPECIES: acyl-CoA desaturase [unclassified Oleiphilus]|uniref:fatty acid desaturase family protein n=3 Tax=Oleiphilus TaxID=141450 RepID=UPI000838D0F5|nr:MULTISPECIES: acyl-CoA desaturase [unclassified Oleiphilus]